MKKLALIGAGTHADAVYPNINFSTYKFIGFFDDKNLKSYNDYPILGKISDVKKMIDLGIVDSVFISIGDNDVRKRIFDEIAVSHYENIINIISSTSTIINDYAIKGRGIFIAHSSFLGANVTISDNSIINTGAIIEHHCKVGMHCNIAPNATLNGIVTLRSLCYVGSSATIIQGLVITDKVLIGAGAVVIKSILNSGIYVGVPAKYIKKLEI